MSHFVTIANERRAIVSGISAVAGALVLVSISAADQSGATSYSNRPLAQATERALDALARAEIVREEATLTGNAPEKLDLARKQCREVLDQLTRIEAEAVVLLRKAYQTRPSQREKNSWTIQQLESLLRNLKVQLARGYRNQALCYEVNSLDQLNALSLALQQLPEVAMQPIDDMSVWRARVEQATCLRLMNKLDEAEQNIKAWQAKSPSARIAAKLQGERLRILLERRDMAGALKLVSSLQQQPETLPPETDDAILATLLAAQDLAEPRRAADLIKRALAQLRHISTSHGPYWLRRAEVRIGRAFSGQTDSNDPEILNYAAANLFAEGQREQAVKTYDRIASLHAGNRDTDQQFAALATAAAIVLDLGRIEEGLRRYQKLAMQHSRHPQAAEQHLRAIGLAAEIARAATAAAQAEAFERYLKMLDQHLAKWPDSDTSQQVRLWKNQAQGPQLDRQRARNLAVRGEREKALAIYKQLSQKNADDASLLEAYAKLLSEGHDLSDLRESLKLWKQIEKRSKPGGPRWWRGRRARLALLKQLGEGERAERLKQLTEILYPTER